MTIIRIKIAEIPGYEEIEESRHPIILDTHRGPVAATVKHMRVSQPAGNSRYVSARIPFLWSFTASRGHETKSFEELEPEAITSLTTRFNKLAAALETEEGQCRLLNAGLITERQIRKIRRLNQENAA